MWQLRPFPNLVPFYHDHPQSPLAEETLEVRSPGGENKEMSLGPDEPCVPGAILLCHQLRPGLARWVVNRRLQTGRGRGSGVLEACPRTSATPAAGKLAEESVLKTQIP